MSDTTAYIRVDTMEEFIAHFNTKRQAIIDVVIKCINDNSIEPGYSYR